jgi:hypothetical protein
LNDIVVAQQDTGDAEQEDLYFRAAQKAVFGQNIRLTWYDPIKLIKTPAEPRRNYMVRMHPLRCIKRLAQGLILPVSYAQTLPCQCRTYATVMNMQTANPRLRVIYFGAKVEISFPAA